MVLADQAAAPCLHRPELAGAQQVVNKLSGDAQQYGSLVGAVGHLFGAGIRSKISRMMVSKFLAHVAGEQSRYRACAQFDPVGGLGAGMSLPRLLPPGDDGGHVLGAHAMEVEMYFVGSPQCWLIRRTCRSQAPRLLVDVVITHGKPGQQRLAIGVRADGE